MRDLSLVNNPYGDDKVISACSIFGMMDVSGKPFSGEPVFRAMENMHDRGNGLGGGFAVYGLYPNYAESYAFHIMYTNQAARRATEEYMEPRFEVEHSEEIPTRKTDGISNEPLLYRYFLQPKISRLDDVSEEDYIVEQVLRRSRLS